MHSRNTTLGRISAGFAAVMPTKTWSMVISNSFFVESVQNASDSDSVGVLCVFDVPECRNAGGWWADLKSGVLVESRNQVPIVCCNVNIMLNESYCKPDFTRVWGKNEEEAGFLGYHHHQWLLRGPDADYSQFPSDISISINVSVDDCVEYQCETGRLWVTVGIKGLDHRMESCRL